MNLSFFAYIDESADDEFPAGSFVKISKLMQKGQKLHMNTDKGGYDLIGLDAISYEDEADLKRQVCVVLRGLNL